MSQAFVLGSGAGPVLPMGPFAMTVKASSTQTQGGLTLLEAGEPPGFRPPMHVHEDAAEGFYVLSREYLVHVDGAAHGAAWRRPSSCPSR